MNGFRYENKYFISTAGYLQLKSRLQVGMTKDAHVSHEDGNYFIRSLYFDDYLQSGLTDKVDGIEKREKFRIRFYDLDDSFIRLESKQKIGKMTKKLSAPLTREQAEAICRGDTWWMYKSEYPLIRNFYLKHRTRLIKPMVLVDYYREAFIFNDVRITFDKHISSGRYALDLFEKAVPTAPVFPSDRMILEVKYDDALPYAIKQLLSGVPMARSAISKYELCRNMQ